MPLSDDIKIIEQERDEHLAARTTLGDKLDLVTRERDALRETATSDATTLGILRADNDRLGSENAMLAAKVAWLEQYTTELRTVAEIVSVTALDMLKKARHGAYKPQPIEKENVGDLPVFLTAEQLEPPKLRGASLAEAASPIKATIPPPNALTAHADVPVFQ